MLPAADPPAAPFLALNEVPTNFARLFLLLIMTPLQLQAGSVLATNAVCDWVLSVPIHSGYESFQVTYDPILL